MPSHPSEFVDENFAVTWFIFCLFLSSPFLASLFGIIWMELSKNWSGKNLEYYSREPHHQIQELPKAVRLFFYSLSPSDSLRRALCNTDGGPVQRSQHQLWAMPVRIKNKIKKLRKKPNFLSMILDVGSLYNCHLSFLFFHFRLHLVGGRESALKIILH